MCNGNNFWRTMWWFPRPVSTENMQAMGLMHYIDNRRKRMVILGFYLGTQLQCSSKNGELQPKSWVLKLGLQWLYKSYSWKLAFWLETVLSWCHLLPQPQTLETNGQCVTSSSLLLHQRRPKRMDFSGFVQILVPLEPTYDNKIFICLGKKKAAAFWSNSPGSYQVCKGLCQIFELLGQRNVSVGVVAMLRCLKRATHLHIFGQSFLVWWK